MPELPNRPISFSNFVREYCKEKKMPLSNFHNKLLMQLDKGENVVLQKGNSIGQKFIYDMHKIYSKKYEDTRPIFR